MNWLLLTIASAVTGAIARILQKVLLKNKDSDLFAFSFIFQMVVAAIFLIYAVLTRSVELPNLTGLGFNIFIMALFYGLGNVFTFKAFKVAEASEVAVIFASSSVWSVLAALVMLSEKLTTKSVFGIMLVVLGIASINLSRHAWRVNKGHLYALLGAILFGIAFTNDAYIIGRYTSIPSYMVLAFTLPAFISLLASPQSIKNIPQYTSGSILMKLSLCTFFYAISSITIFAAYKAGGPASIISPIQQTSIIFTVVLGYLFLNERDNVLKKIIGTVLTFLGVLLLI